MLVLSRLRDEVTVLSVPGHRPIKVTVLGIYGDKVRLGFEADESVVIDREEVWLSKQGDS